MAFLLPLFYFIGTIYAQQQQGRYNILFLQSDEMDGRVLDPTSPFWNIMEMPNLRSLAASGINFIKSYCNSPICASSRASMWTGRYVNNISAWSNVKSITAQVENPNEADPNCANIIGYSSEWCIEQGKIQNITTTIKQSMISAGYNVKLCGKMDIGGGMSVGPNMTTTGDGFHSPQNGNWSSQLSGCNQTSETWCPGDIIHSWTRKANLSSSEWLAPYDGEFISITSKQGGYFTPHDIKVTSECIDFLDNYGNNQDQDKPFLLYCSMVNPHPPYWTNSTWMNNLNYTALNTTFSELIRNFNNSWINMNQADKYNSFAEGVGDINIHTEWAYNLYLAYFASCSELDYRMGLIINKLKQYPKIYENTLILYTSDHGELHLEHLQLEKMSMYEGSARVPFIVSGPNIPSNVIINNFTTLVDIFPTFLDTANISYSNKIYPKNLNGFSLSPFFNWNWINSNKNNPYLKRASYAFSEFHGDCTNTAQYMLRQNEYKLILYSTNPPYQNYKPQLFNINIDPNELNNCANQNKNILQNMTNTLNNILISTGGGDYNFIDSKCQNEGKQNFLRWQTIINGNNSNLWINYTKAAYTNFNQNDLQKMQNWINNVTV